MSNIVDPLSRQIASRIRSERERRGWTLAQLGEASGVSRAMINRIERGESNPTARVLGKLSAAFELSISSLLAAAEATDAPAADGRGGVGDGELRRHDDADEWRDPETGYRRRQITGPRFPAEITEVSLPAGAYVPYPAAAFAFIRQVVWVLEGGLTFHDGSAVHELRPGDTIELGAPAPRAFANTTDVECRYVVAVVRAGRP